MTSINIAGAQGQNRVVVPDLTVEIETPTRGGGTYMPMRYMSAKLRKVNPWMTRRHPTANVFSNSKKLNPWSRWTNKSISRTITYSLIQV